MAALGEQGISRWLSILYTHVLYVWLLLWPSELCFDHGYASIAPVTSIADPRNISIICLYVTLLSLALV